MVNFGYPYNDIVICKDSTDYLGFSIEYSCHTIIIGTSLDDPGLEILTDKIQFSDVFSQVCSVQYLAF